MRQIAAFLALVLLAVTMTGCEPALKPGSMVSLSVLPEAAKARFASQISLGSSSAKMPLGEPSFREALERTLKYNDFLVPPDKAAYRLDVTVLELDLSNEGSEARTQARIRYDLTERDAKTSYRFESQTKGTRWRPEITAGEIAAGILVALLVGPTQSTQAKQRLEASWGSGEDAVRANIAEFMASLDKFPAGFSQVVLGAP
jgi:hypothetical protein